MIENYFSTPLYFADAGPTEVTEEILSIIGVLELENYWQRDNDTAKTSYKSDIETNIIKNKNLSVTENFIKSETQKYLYQTNNFIIDESIRIESSWINLFDQNDFIGWHDHGYQPNTCSGVFYASAPQGCGKIIFKSPNPYGITFPNRSDNYSNIISCEVKDNMLILFPSWLLHKVEPNRIKEKRISLAFNLSFNYR